MANTLKTRRRRVGKRSGLEGGHGQARKGTRTVCTDTHRNEINGPHYGRQWVNQCARVPF